MTIPSKYRIQCFCEPMLDSLLQEHRRGLCLAGRRGPIRTLILRSMAFVVSATPNHAGFHLPLKR